MKINENPIFFPILGLLAGALTALLRLWQNATGIDSEGLYLPVHPAGILMILLGVGFMMLLVVLTGDLPKNGRYHAHFPPSVAAAAGCAAAAVCYVMSSLGKIGSADPVIRAAGWLGFLAAAGLGAAGYCRFAGKRPQYFVHAAICIFLALKMFELYQHWSSVPQLGRYLYQILAIVALVLSMYQRAAFDAALGSPRRFLFLGSTAVFLCVAALPKNQDLLFFLGSTAWAVTNLCTPAPMPAGEEE